MFSLTRQEQAVVIFLIGAIILGGGALYYRRVIQSKVEPQVVGAKINVEESQQIMVDIAGAVWRPGVYTFQAGSRVKDAVDKASPRSNANLELLNLASSLRDGQKIVVPTKISEGDSKKSASSVEKLPAGLKRINLNTASKAELEALPGIGPVRALSIIEYRTQHGGFKNIEGIKKVEGVGEITFKKVENLISVY
ncbi:helix-hairpin-helix domain-containing protein [bacterium]|nr:helix-hairpin-helix domain-containing protein [bacterium]MCK4326388.1 helix-hairpin-helix domain-containing protein [bacterium]